MAGAAAQNRYAGGPSPSGLADVLDLILDKEGLMESVEDFEETLLECGA